MTDKQTEALKLALEALKQIDEAMPFPVAKLAQQVIREALAEQPAQQRHISYVCPQCHWSLDKQPASKPWVGLTDEEVDSWELPDCPTVFEFAQFIEAKLKEKNT